MVEDRLSSLLSVWQVERLQGRAPSAAELCRACPELAEELEQRIAVLRRMNDLMRPSPTPPRAGRPRWRVGRGRQRANGVR
jgi:hypothetical protein